MKCLLFGDLTKTPQDAVTITRQFGIRYLWIDALCIIQDSHSVWSIEAANMAKIYWNALITIAAEAAAYQKVGAEVEFRFFFREPVWNSTLSARVKGLAFCQHVPEAADLCHLAGDYRRVRSPVINKGKWSIDAIAGIAEFISKVMDDKFQAGLWTRELWGNLLWKSCSGDGWLPIRIHSIKVPFWTWASVKGATNYKVLGSSSLVCMSPVVEILGIEVVRIY